MRDKTLRGQQTVNLLIQKIKFQRGRFAGTTFETMGPRMIADACACVAKSCAVDAASPWARGGAATADAAASLERTYP